MAQAKRGGNGQAGDARRGRPSSARAGTIDADIRRAALALFLDRGFDAVTMDMIAADARVSKPTLYTRHASKADLLRSVVAQEIGGWLATAVAEGGGLPADLAGRLRHHGHAIVTSRGWAEFGALARLIGSVAETHPDIVQAAYAAGLEPAMRMLTEQFRAAATAEGRGAADWDFLTQMLFHAIYGWHNAASALGPVGEAEVRAFVEGTVATVLAAVGPVRG